jgi:hypothetical protein
MEVTDLSNIRVAVPFRAVNMLVNGYVVQSIGRMDNSGSYLFGSFDPSGVFTKGLNAIYEYEAGKSYIPSQSDFSVEARRIDQVNQDRTKSYATPIFTTSRFAMNQVASGFNNVA